MIVIFCLKGPNYCWHIDGYGKLKQFRYPIHGCIDRQFKMNLAKYNIYVNRFSRKVLWLKINSSNNDPDIVTSNFLECVGQIKGTDSFVLLALSLILQNVPVWLGQTKELKTAWLLIFSLFLGETVHTLFSVLDMENQLATK